MGEDSLELQHGHFVKASDSWKSGVKGAEPGIIMPADPQPGDAYRREYYPPGKALDEAHVLGTRGSFEVPYGRFKRALVTSEYSPLEPQTEQKYYVAGVGEIQERVVKGHHEEFQLVRVNLAAATAAVTSSQSTPGQPPVHRPCAGPRRSPATSPSPAALRPRPLWVGYDREGLTPQSDAMGLVR
jgi:hypothetical protein